MSDVTFSLKNLFPLMIDINASINLLKQRTPAALAFLPLTLPGQFTESQTPSEAKSPASRLVYKRWARAGFFVAQW